MAVNHRCRDYAAAQSEEEMIDVMRKGPWTMEEDLKLTNCIAIHGPGQWSYLAGSAGLKRTGKSCRLRWLNYLRPDVKRGNLTLEEQLVILELHSRWGNRWSKIAEHLPGRTDNEVKNYWRTRVQKLAKQLKCDVNSLQFRYTMRHLWLPSLVERVRAESSIAQPPISNNTATNPSGHVLQTGIALAVSNFKAEISTASSSETPPAAQVSPASELTYHDDFQGSNWYFQQEGPITGLISTACSISYFEEERFDSQILEENNNGWLGGGDSLDYLLSKDYSWLIRDQAFYRD